ncbi:hypothetical protein G3T14_21400 [Methylobacterium sp. BTF04]|uniref:hypothetical protein n=1 Tax=Methylobacterium sp. BTF04 TaxID=2708300 RepID=UPI0013CFA78B|nr:hypothetical protein [Methylobacterium sp. BTF04]NEU14643.1 hypothetical protein [Methylobacterium sp. BTF04]
METAPPSSQRRSARQTAIYRRPDQRPCYTQRPIVGSVTVEFPIPPSANKLYANRGTQGRIKTTAYRAWRNSAVLMASVKRPGRISGPCDVVIHLPPFQGDTDNRIKPCLDAAKELGVIADDGKAYVRNVSAIREPAGTSVRMVFTMVAIDEATRAEVEVRAIEHQRHDYIASAMNLTEAQVAAVLAGARP